VTLDTGKSQNRARARLLGRKFVRDHLRSVGLLRSNLASGLLISGILKEKKKKKKKKNVGLMVCHVVVGRHSRRCVVRTKFNSTRNRDEELHDY